MYTVILALIHNVLINQQKGSKKHISRIDIVDGNTRFAALNKGLANGVKNFKIHGKVLDLEEGNHIFLHITAVQ